MKRNTIKLAGITMAAIILLTGCGKVPKLENGQDSVVSLKGEKISVDSLYKEMKNKYALSVLIDMIDTNILDKKYKDVSDIKKDVDDQIQLMIKQYGGEDKLLQLISQSGFYSLDELRTYLTLQYKRSKAIEDYAKSIVTDSEINKYYDENIFGDIKAKHILISPQVNNNATDAEKEQADKDALAKANEVITKLKNGEDWDKLAKEYSSDDANKDKGGELDSFTHGDMVEEFETAARNLEVGKYTTEPVKTIYGYHIIYKVSEKEKPQLKTVKDTIIEKISKEKLSEDSTLEITALEKLRKEYDVKIEDDTLNSQYERYIKNLKKNASSN